MFGLDCQVNTFAWFYLLGAAMNIVMAVILVRYRRRSQSIAWFQTFSIIAAIIQIVQAWLGCTTSQSVFEVMTDLSQLNMVLPIVELIFVFYFINRERWLNKFWVAWALGTFSVIALLIAWGSDLIVSHQLSAAVEQAWGLRTAAIGSLKNFQGAFLGIAYILPIVLMAWYYRRLQQPQKRHEVRLVLFGMSLPTFFAILVEETLPPLIHTPAFPVSIPLVAIMNVIIGYAMIRYGLHIFNLNSATANITQIMPGGLVILDHTGTVQYANDGAIALLGYSEADLVGNSIDKLLKTPELQAQFQREVVEPLSRQSKVTISDVTLFRADTKPLPVSLNATSVRERGQLINTVVVFSDISPLKTAEARILKEKASVEHKVHERTKELSEARAQLAASVVSLPFGFALINNDDEIVFSNGVLAKLFNRTIPAIPAASKAVLEKIHKDYKESIDILACVKQARVENISIERNIIFGPRFFRFFFLPVIAGDHAIGTVLLMEDTTEAKALERSRDEFFSIASHELRTPLTAIRGNSQMILDYYKEQIKDPSLSEMIHDIHDSGTRLITIVNDFLDVSRLEQGRIVFDKKAFDIAGVAKQTLREYDVTGSRHKLSLELEGAKQPVPLVYADLDRVRQILVNVVSNGIKYTKEGGVTLSLRPEGNVVKIAIIDTGQGIPVESQHLLFHKFQQASNNILTRDNTQSTGLGLYISRLLAEGMGGKLYLEKSEVNKGSVFILELPVASSSQAPNQEVDIARVLAHRV
jgi:PAS domain S-box-containing protein